MVAKTVLLFCAQALTIQLIKGNCINNGFTNNNAFAAANSNAFAANNNAFAGNVYNSNANLAASNAFANNGYVNNNIYANNPNYGLGNIAANNGGSFTVQSFSPIAPNGVFVQSSNNIEGGLAVEGNLPFLSAVALEGLVSSEGQGRIAYNCGNGNSGIVSESYGPSAVANNGLAYGGVVNAGLANNGLAYGAGVVNGGLANAALGVGNAAFNNVGVANAAALANAGVARIGNVGVAGNCNSLY